jgi:hypothetical protein
MRRFHSHVGRPRTERGQAHRKAGMGGRTSAFENLPWFTLALLADRPQRGYEIIKAFEERSESFDVPSPAVDPVPQIQRVVARMGRARRTIGTDSESLRRARRGLKTALASTGDSRPEEQQRLTEILERATAEILG